MINDQTVAIPVLVAHLIRSLFYIFQGLMIALVIAVLNLALLSSMIEGSSNSNSGSFLVAIIATVAVSGCFLYWNQDSSVRRAQTLGLRPSIWRQVGFFVGLLGLAAIMIIIK